MDRRIIEGIEACRPGSDDLQSADLSDVARRVKDDPAVQADYQYVQTWDAAIAGAMEQVGVPSGLAERILDRLAAAESSTTLPAAVDPAALRTAEADPTALPLPAQSGWLLLWSPPQFSRRQWLGAASTIAATLLVAVFLANWLGRGHESSLETIADGWVQQLSPTWQNMRKAPQGFDIPPAITASPAGWQRIGQVGSGRGVAYTLVHATAGTAKLFVARLSVGGLPTAPPGVPQSTTGGKAVSYWQNGSLLYVLIVDGGERSYRAFVSTVPTPLA
jgi:hypothetical protein